MSRSLIKLVALTFCMASLCVAAFAQQDGKKGAKDGKRSAPKRGTITAVSAGSITIKAPGKKGDQKAAETATFEIGPRTKLAARKPLKLSAITSPKWAIVTGKLSDDQSSIEAKIISLALAEPKNAKPGARKGRATGTLSVKDGKATLKAGDKTIKISTTEETKIMAQVAIEAKDLKVGDVVQVMVRKSKSGEQVVGQILVQPPAPKKAGRGGRAKKKADANK